MKKIYLLLLTVLTLSLVSSAQKTNGSVKGTLQDSTGSQGLADATVSVMRLKDSSLISFTVTDRNGNFEVKNIEEGTYNIIASYAGLKSLKKSFTINSTSPVVDLGVLNMARYYKNMDEIVIIDDAPVKIKGDTVEFKADAFKSNKPNATVEDLLKKIPGVEVDKEGTVKAQGEQVQKVYVDGKEFFGTDPKLATKNLTQDMVESVQVYDDMSDQAKFTKIDDGSRSKAINIKLKKDKKNGYFGKAMAGAGTNDRYESSLSVNRFKGSRQISLIGAANNLSKQGFSFSDVISSMGMSGLSGGGGGFSGGGFGGGGGRMVIGGGGGGFGGVGGFGGGGSVGISKPLSLGLNYRDIWGPKIDVSGSLFGSQTKTNTTQSTLRHYTYNPYDLTNSLPIEDAYSNTLTTNQNVRFNFRMEYKIDSMNSLLYYPSLTVQHSQTQSLDTSIAFASADGISRDYKRLTQKNARSSTRDGYNMNQNLLFRHRFGKIGRTITLGVTSSFNHSEGTNDNYSPYNYYRADGSVESAKVIDQQSQSKIDGHNNTISTSYTEPIGRNKLIELNYAYTNNQNNSDRKTYDVDPLSGKHDVINTAQTNYFENGYISHRAGANFRVQQKKYNYQLGMGFQTNEQDNRSVRALTGKDTTINYSFTNLYPTASFTYNFTRNKNLRFNYRGRTNQPTVSQLQDVPDYSNPVQVRVGNPSLKQEFTNSFNAGYNTFNILSFRFFAANLSFSQTMDKIVNSTDRLPKKYASPNDTSTLGKQLIMPVNISGAYSGTGFVTLGFPSKNPKLKGSSINSTTLLSYNRDVSMVLKQVNYSKLLLATQTLGVNYSYKEKIDLSLKASLTYNKATYDQQPASNTEYWSQTYSADLTFTLPKNFVLSTDIDYYVNTGRSAGYNQSIPMWNGSLSKLVFKNKAGEIKLAVNDLLNQNTSITRNTQDNRYYEDVRSNVIQRYFMLSFTYALNRMGGKNIMQQIPRQFQRGMRDMRVGQ
jgi:hypothetical protein